MSFKGWEKVKVTTCNGKQADAVAPVIISASRSTDIPSFYAPWFMQRLQKGYCEWTNPFNRRTMLVSFQNTRLIVFWSKNPLPMLSFLDELDQRGINYLFHFTLNDYEDEGYEKKVPPLQERIETFKQLSEKIGKSKILWRFDPLILSNDISPEILLRKIEYIGNEIYPCTERLTISFLTLYAKVQKKLKNAAILARQADEETISILCNGLQELNSRWGLRLVSCAESFDLGKYDITPASCIDPQLIARLFGDDPLLGGLLGVKEYADPGAFSFRKSLKDPGQRKYCNCMVSKDIGRYDTCPHLCTYCYANSSPEKVLRNCGENPNSL